MNPANHPANRSRSNSGGESSKAPGSGTRKGGAATQNNVYAAVFTAASHRTPSASPTSRSAAAAAAANNTTMSDSPSAVMTRNISNRNRSFSAGMTSPSSTTTAFSFHQSQKSSATSSIPTHPASSVASSHSHGSAPYSKRRGEVASRVIDTSSRRSSSDHSSKASFSPTNYPTTLPMKSKRKLRKNNREKQRRSELNDKFDELCELLRLSSNSSGGKVEKYTVLSEAVSTITTLRREVFELKNERNEARAENHRLSSALTQPHMAIATPTPLPSVAALSPKTGLPFAMAAAIPGASSPMNFAGVNSAFPFMPSPAFAVGTAAAAAAAAAQNSSAFTFQTTSTHNNPNNSTPQAAVIPGHHHGHTRKATAGGASLGFGSQGSFSGFGFGVPPLSAIPLKMDPNSPIQPNSAGHVGSGERSHERSQSVGPRGHQRGNSNMSDNNNNNSNNSNMNIQNSSSSSNNFRLGHSGGSGGGSSPTHASLPGHRGSGNAGTGFGSQTAFTFTTFNTNPSQNQQQPFGGSSHGVPIEIRRNSGHGHTPSSGFTPPQGHTLSTGPGSGTASHRVSFTLPSAADGSRNIMMGDSDPLMGASMLQNAGGLENIGEGVADYFKMEEIENGDDVNFTVFN